MRRAARDDQKIVRNFAVEQLHDLAARVDRRRLAKNHAGIALPPQYPRIGDAISAGFSAAVATW